MREIELKTKFLVYDNFEDLPENDQLLMIRAKEATVKSYSPYSNFKVGCAILLENGSIISAANQENAAYPACICAERTALSAAAAQFPDVAPVKIAVTVKSEDQKTDPVAPCGECRQTIFEYQKRYNKPIEILLRGEVGRVIKLNSIADLLPFAFSKSDLENDKE